MSTNLRRPDSGGGLDSMPSVAASSTRDMAYKYARYTVNRQDGPRNLCSFWCCLQYGIYSDCGWGQPWSPLGIGKLQWQNFMSTIAQQHMLV